MTALCASVALAGVLAFGPGDAEAFRARRRREQNRLAGDLAIHTAVAAYCSTGTGLVGEGGRCWVWGLGLEGGIAVDRQHPSRGGAWSRGVFLGPSPVTLGSWYFADQHRFTDFEVGFVEPFARVRVGEVYPGPGQNEGRPFWALVVGMRSWVGWAPLRLGLEVSYELGPPRVSAGFSLQAFAGLAWHYAPAR